MSQLHKKFTNDQVKETRISSEKGKTKKLIRNRNDDLSLKSFSVRLWAPILSPLWALLFDIFSFETLRSTMMF